MSSLKVGLGMGVERKAKRGRGGKRAGKYGLRSSIVISKIYGKRSSCTKSHRTCYTVYTSAET